MTTPGKLITLTGAAAVALSTWTYLAPVTAAQSALDVQPRTDLSALLASLISAGTFTLVENNVENNL